VAVAPLIMVLLYQALMLVGVPGTVRLRLRLPVALLIGVILVLADQSSLRRAGWRPPSVWWLVLGPVYSFLRPRGAGPSAAMGVTWCASFVAWIVVPTALAATVGVHISTDRIGHRLEVDLEQRAGAQVTVTCPAPLTVRIGESFDCAVRSGADAATATVTVLSSYGGYRIETHPVGIPTA
jgi:hypothetical protein